MKVAVSPSITHPLMLGTNWPVKASLFEECGHGWDLYLGKNVPVGHTVFPRDAEYSVKAVHMKGMKSPFLVSQNGLSTTSNRLWDYDSMCIYFGIHKS